jgi:stress-induced morphogen
MATILHGSQDKAVKAIKKVLDRYESDHPGAAAELYRQNNASIRIRIIDERFRKTSKPQRHDEVFNFIADELNHDDILQEVSILLLLAPSEQTSSLMNLEFDDPIPSSF